MSLMSVVFLSNISSKINSQKIIINSTIKNYNKLPLSLFWVFKYSLFLLSNNDKVFENEVFVSITRFLSISIADSLVFSTSLDHN